MSNLTYDPATHTLTLAVSSSSIHLLQCPLKAYLNLCLGRVSASDTSFEMMFGTFFHALMELRNRMSVALQRLPTWEELEPEIEPTISIAAATSGLSFPLASQSYLSREYLIKLFRAYHHAHPDYTSIALDPAGKPIIEYAFEEEVFAVKVPAFPLGDKVLNGPTVRCILRGRIDARIGTPTDCSPIDYKTMKHWRDESDYSFSHARDPQFRLYDYVTWKQGLRDGFHCDSFLAVPIITVKPKEDDRWAKLTELGEEINAYKVMPKRTKAQDGALAKREAAHTDLLLDISVNPDLEPAWNFPDPIRFSFEEESRREFGADLARQLHSFVDTITAHAEPLAARDWSYAPRSFACTNGYRPCPYTTFCSADSSLRDMILESMFVGKVNRG